MEALLRSARRRASVAVAGLDPDPDRLPPELYETGLPAAGAVRRFCLGILEAVEPEVAAVKLQSAYFERLGPAGMEIYAEIIREAAALDLPVIADVKRGDIGPVAAAYAEAHLRVYGATCVTVNPYMGADAVTPFLEEVRRLGQGGGAFVLVATSNPSAGTLQAHGEPPLLEVSAGLVARLGETGSPDGYPDTGAVVGATRPEVGARVRGILPDHLFLVPGYGAQGGTASGVRALLDSHGSGVLVNSSRSILYAHEKGPEDDYRTAARAAAHRTRQELASAGARP